MLFKQNVFSPKGGPIYRISQDRNEECWNSRGRARGLPQRRVGDFPVRFVLNSNVSVTDMKDPIQICDCADKEPKD
jgi:hypothetical protein